MLVLLPLNAKVASNSHGLAGGQRLCRLPLRSSPSGDIRRYIRAGSGEALAVTLETGYRFRICGSLETRGCGAVLPIATNMMLKDGNSKEVIEHGAEQRDLHYHDEQKRLSIWVHQTEFELFIEVKNEFTGNSALYTCWSGHHEYDVLIDRIKEFDVFNPHTDIDIIAIFGEFLNTKRLSDDFDGSDDKTKSTEPGGKGKKRLTGEIQKTALSFEGEVLDAVREISAEEGISISLYLNNALKERSDIKRKIAKFKRERALQYLRST